MDDKHASTKRFLDKLREMYSSHPCGPLGAVSEIARALDETRAQFRRTKDPALRVEAQEAMGALVTSCISFASGFGFDERGSFYDFVSHAALVVADLSTPCEQISTKH